MNQFRCKLAQVVHGGKGMKRSTLEVRRSRSQKAEVRFGGLVEESFSISFGRVGCQFRINNGSKLSFVSNTAKQLFSV